MVIGPVWRQEIEEFGRILEPVALVQAVDDAAIEIGDVAGHALHLRILDRLDDDVVAEPVDTDLADFLGDGRTGAKDNTCGQRAADQFSQGSLPRFEFAGLRWGEQLGFASR